jgi:hypothetical protein
MSRDQPEVHNGRAMIECLHLLRQSDGKTPVAANAE